MKKAIWITLLTLFSITVYAQDEAEAVVDYVPLAVISVVAFGLLFYTYKIKVENIKLRQELKAYRIRLKKALDEGRGEVKPIATETPDQAVIDDQIVGKEGAKGQFTKQFYWDRVSSTVGIESVGEKELSMLEAKKKDIEDIIELTKTKYHRREIDEKNFGDIIKEHQKQIIELEAKISKLNKKEE